MQWVLRAATDKQTRNHTYIHTHKKNAKDSKDFRTKDAPTTTMSRTAAGANSSSFSLRRLLINNHDNICMKSQVKWGVWNAGIAAMAANAKDLGAGLLFCLWCCSTGFLGVQFYYFNSPGSSVGCLSYSHKLSFATIWMVHV